MPWKPKPEANAKQVLGLQACLLHLQPVAGPRGAGPGSCLLIFLFLLHEGTQVTLALPSTLPLKNLLGKVQIRERQLGGAGATEAQQRD